LSRQQTFRRLNQPEGLPTLAILGLLGRQSLRLSAVTLFEQTINSAAKAELVGFSDRTPFPENAELSQKFVNAFCKSGVCPAMLSVVWLNSFFQFLFFAESTRTIHGQRNFSSRFGFILLAANSSTTLCSHSTHQLNRAGLADERRTSYSNPKPYENIPRLLGS
jgi:hypothetical protein